MTYADDLCAKSASYLMEFVSKYDMNGDGPNPSAGKKGITFEDTYSDRSYSCDLLERLGMVKGAEGNNWVFLVDKDETLSFLCERRLTDEERGRLVGEYLMTLCEWEDVPTTRTEFLLPFKAKCFYATLVGYGLCEAQGDALQWTEHAGPAMRYSGIWDTQDRSSSDVKTHEDKAEAEKIWELLPRSTKETLMLQTDKDSTLAVWHFLRQHWDGERWEKREEIFPPAKMELAKAFFELIRSKQAGFPISATP